MSLAFPPARSMAAIAQAHGYGVARAAADQVQSLHRTTARGDADLQARLAEAITAHPRWPEVQLCLTRLARQAGTAEASLRDAVWPMTARDRATVRQAARYLNGPPATALTALVLEEAQDETYPWTFPGAPEPFVEGVLGQAVIEIDGLIAQSESREAECRRRVARLIALAQEFGALPVRAGALRVTPDEAPTETAPELQAVTPATPIGPIAPWATLLPALLEDALHLLLVSRPPATQALMAEVLLQGDPALWTLGLHAVGEMLGERGLAGCPVTVAHTRRPLDVTPHSGGLILRLRSSLVDVPEESLTVRGPASGPLGVPLEVVLRDTPTPEPVPLPMWLLQEALEPSEGLEPGLALLETAARLVAHGGMTPPLPAWARWCPAALRQLWQRQGVRRALERTPK